MEMREGPTCHWVLCRIIQRTLAWLELARLAVECVKKRRVIYWPAQQRQQQQLVEPLNKRDPGADHLRRHWWN
jgi:hypothetical protein